jgi:hypothetical protein
MDKQLKNRRIGRSLIIFWGLLLSVSLTFAQGTLQSLISLATSKVESNYTVPSFTELKRQLKFAQANPTLPESVIKLQTALDNLKDKEMPYNIVMNINQDPKTRTAFNWFTNANITGGKVEIVVGKATTYEDFSTPLKTVNATCTQINNLNYNVSANNLINEAGFSGNNLKKSYTENKALVTGLTPNTTYSFRVGKAGAWSEIGTFTTAKTGKEPFSFFYTTDPQANTYDMFNISQTTTHAGFARYPNVDLWLHCGDLVETSGGTNSEWEWEQLLETQQDILLHVPIAPIQGNHDVSTNLNFRRHFNTEGFGTTDNTGSTYSYIYGDALFFAINSELYSSSTYITALKNWMQSEVAAHPEVKWRIVYYHKTVFTGSTSHQNDSDGRTWRDAMAPFFQQLGIDIAFQGHDHIYEAIGVVYNKQLVPNSVSGVKTVPVHARENVTGKLNGIFNTQNGTLYFLNNSSGKKKYEPRPFAQMNGGNVSDVPNYPSLFTGRFGQTGYPTYSHVAVTSDTITITTYEVFDDGSDSLFDEIKVVKSLSLQEFETIIGALNEADYTVPSFTELKKRLKFAQNNPTLPESLVNLRIAFDNLKNKQTPYNVVMTINQDPTSQMGFNWFTNAGIEDGQLEIVEGTASEHSAFVGATVVNAAHAATGALPYAHNRNGLMNIAGIPDGATRSYTEHKALATNLTPNTTYSFRVGKEGYWSEIGTFSTAKAGKEPFTFIYTTDPQANTYEMFDVSQTTTHAAFSTYPNADFWLHCGDLIESGGNPNSEWEWEQLFESQQDLFYNIPFAPIIGNHDNSVNKNFTKHFNTYRPAFDNNATTPGSSYSYIYGDALFFAINSEEYNNNTYTNALIAWMQNEIEAHSDVKWRIVHYHKTVFTGSSSHQNDADGRTWRDKMTSAFDAMGIDIAFQGHDHIYEVLGPIYDKQLVPNSVSGVNSVPVHARENATGKLNGTFNTQNGTLYFLNNSSGLKKYEPRPFNQMNGGNIGDILDYPSLFTGRFGQTGNPTYSNVSVSSQEIIITTYEVLGDGVSVLFDEIKVVKFELPDNFTIAASYGSGGTISPNGVVKVVPGASQTFNITPKAGYKIAQVLVDGINNALAVANKYHTFENVMENHTLSVTFTYIQEELFYINASVTTTGGSISPSGKISAMMGDNVTFTFTPQTGYQLKEVLVDGINNVAAVASKSYTFENITASHTIVGKFEKQSFVITASTATAGGTISPAGETIITQGGSKAYTISTQTGYIIDKVLIDDILDEKATSSGKHTFSNVSASHTIVAYFKPRTYDITATQTQNGTVSPDGVTATVHGGSTTYNIVPNAGYMIKTVLVDGKNNAGAVSSGEYTFTNVTAKHIISATFTPLAAIPMTPETETLNQLTIYPNPTNGEFRVSSFGFNVTEIEIFDMFGKKVQSLMFNVQGSETLNFKPETLNFETVIDISHLPSGIYFIRIETENETVTRKVIKN